MEYFCLSRALSLPNYFWSNDRYSRKHVCHATRQSLIQIYTLKFPNISISMTSMLYSELEETLTPLIARCWDVYIPAGRKKPRSSKEKRGEDLKTEEAWMASTLLLRLLIMMMRSKKMYLKKTTLLKYFCIVSNQQHERLTDCIFSFLLVWCAIL
jgi:hypothetical protein